MKPRFAVIVTLGLSMASSQVFALDETYQKPLGAYAAEINKEPDPPHNSSFYGTLAANQAKRALYRSMRGLESGLLSVDDGDGRLRNDASGDISIASPEIFGNVRGDVNIVVQRGAIRGRVISVRRH